MIVLCKFLLQIVSLAVCCHGRFLQGSGGIAQASMVPTQSPVDVFVEPPRQPFQKDDDDEDDEGGPLVVYVVVMLVVAIIAASCCVRNGGYNMVDNYQGAEQASQDFQDKISNSRWFVIKVSQGAISRRLGCIKGCQSRTLPRKHIHKALFFSTRLKYQWNWLLASTQFAVGWISFFSTIIALFAPDHRGNSVIGFAALFLSELILHFWYGFMRYANFCSWILGIGTKGEEDNLFQDISHIFGVLYHNGLTEHHGNKTLMWLGIPFTLVFHLSSVAGFLATVIGCSFLCASEDDDSNKRRSRRSRQKEEESAGIVAMGALGGALLGSFFYPLIFLFSTTTKGKCAAAIFHHVSNEYYEARLFQKSPREFLVSILTKFITDICDIDIFLEGGDIDIEGEIANDEEVGDLKNDMKDNVDARNVGKQKVKRNKDETETDLSSSHADATTGHSILEESSRDGTMDLPPDRPQDMNTLPPVLPDTTVFSSTQDEDAERLAKKLAKKAKKKKKKERKEREAARKALEHGEASESNDDEGDLEAKTKPKKSSKKSSKKPKSSKKTSEPASSPEGKKHTPSEAASPASLTKQSSNGSISV